MERKRCFANIFLTLQICEQKNEKKMKWVLNF